MDREGVQIPGTTLGATNSPPQHEVEHHGGNHQRVECQDDDEQALGAGVHGWNRCRLEEEYEVVELGIAGGAEADIRPLVALSSLIESP